ncbi:hypothetical protein FH972_026947 [Carpinus fangiana]|uniref:Wall-associated receptor kinase galacturonan-binding domain-containing protein n=1 Tax=Carpinus fangiana TaxID=176857 RepID=A0A5N6L5I9_9ROSI|nr:hypothetical protein FH972_026947 [Carpinus fangiana]
MAGRVLFSAGLSALILVVLVHEISCSSAEDGHLCAASSCGDIHNISYPFQLQDQPQNCGHPNYTLSCEKNQTVLRFYAEKYFVRQINYENYTIRVVDSGIHQLTIPRYFSYEDPYQTWVSKSPTSSVELSKGTVVFVMCENPVNSTFYLETSTCFSNIGEYSYNSSKGYQYVKVGITKASDVEDSCQIERMVRTSWPGNISCSDVHNALVYGFELSWFQLNCGNCGSGHDCYLDDVNRVRCEPRFTRLGRVLFSAGLSALILVVLVHEISCSSAEDGHLCAPSSCGDIHNISDPFRLQDQPQNCGHPNYTLSCEKNQTVLHLYAGKYYVRQINYENYTIRVVDSGIHQLSIPRYFLNSYNFSYYEDPYQTRLPRTWRYYDHYSELSTGTVVFVMCENPVNSRFYLETSTCFRNIGEYSSNSSKRYRYVKVGVTNASSVEDSCEIERMVQTSWPGNDDPNISCSDVLNALVYGFELSWFQLNCGNCGSVHDCYLDDANRVRCEPRMSILGVIRDIVYYCGEASLSKKLFA